MMKKITPQETDSAIMRIRKYIREKGFSNLGFAKLADVNERTIRGLFEENPDPRISTLRKMEAVIPKNYTPEENLPSQ